MNPVLAAQYTANQSTTEDCEGPLRITISTAGTISNANVITSIGSNAGVSQGTINLDGFSNTGTITSANYDYFNTGGSITNFQNFGTITGGTGYSAGFYTQIGVVTNFLNFASVLSR
ncbi:MAG: hypothetical protein HQ457_11340 [Betaproteobacteria bacterium]|nr:hypothetical protein [Betaproteobacteria bacterium]